MRVGMSRLLTALLVAGIAWSVGVRIRHLPDGMMRVAAVRLHRFRDVQTARRYRKKQEEMDYRAHGRRYSAGPQGRKHCRAGTSKSA